MLQYNLRKKRTNALPRHGPVRSDGIVFLCERGSRSWMGVGKVKQRGRTEMRAAQARGPPPAHRSTARSCCCCRRSKKLPGRRPAHELTSRERGRGRSCPAAWTGARAVPEPAAINSMEDFSLFRLAWEIGGRREMPWHAIAVRCSKHAMRCDAMR